MNLSANKDFTKFKIYGPFFSVEALSKASKRFKDFLYLAKMLYFIA